MNQQLQTSIQKFLADYAESGAAQTRSSLKAFACLQAFVSILPQVQVALHEADSETAMELGDWLWDTCDLLLSCFSKVRRDEQSEEIAAYIHEHKVVKSLDNLLRHLPQKEHESDSVFADSLRLLQAWQSLRNLQPVKPSLLIFDTRTLELVLSSRKSAICVAMENGDGAHVQSYNYQSLHRGRSFREYFVYERGKTYPIYVQGNDEIKAYVAITGLDKVDVKSDISEYSASCCGFKASSESTALEQFQLWWDGQYPEAKWQTNPRAWLLYFELIETKSSLICRNLSMRKLRTSPRFIKAQVCRISLSVMPAKIKEQLDKVVAWLKEKKFAAKEIWIDRNICSGSAHWEKKSAFIKGILGENYLLAKLRLCLKAFDDLQCFVSKPIGQILRIK